MISFVIIVVVIAVAAAFSLQNATPVALTFLSWHFEASLAIIVLLSLLAGVMIGVAVVSWARLRRWARKKVEPGPEQPKG